MTAQEKSMEVLANVNSPNNEDGFMFGSLCDPECPWCRQTFPSAAPRPSCNECECCFCSEACRVEWHMANNKSHDYHKPWFL